MSDYTVKREKEGILRIQAEGTKMPSSLTINERDYADDKQLIVGGGSGSGDVKTAKILLETPDNSANISQYISTPNFICMLYPAEDSAPAAYTYPHPIYGKQETVSHFNTIMESGCFAIAPAVLFPAADSYNVNLTGDAEIITISDDGEEHDAIYITGDCTITFVSKQV